jgi:hypothetical protein
MTDVENLEAELKAVWDKQWNTMSKEEREAYLKRKKNEETAIDKLKEIIKIAYALKWIYPASNMKGASYPLMQLSEVEKCMLAMTDDFELKRMRQWYEETSGKKAGEKK